MAVDGTRRLDLTGADGQALEVSLLCSDGREVRMEGVENASDVSKVHRRTFHDTWKQNGKVIGDLRGVVSEDGRILKIAVAATDQQNRPIHNNVTFPKQ